MQNEQPKCGSIIQADRANHQLSQFVHAPQGASLKNSTFAEVSARVTVLCVFTQGSSIPRNLGLIDIIPLGYFNF